jgi:hypothetical protein
VAVIHEARGDRVGSDRLEGVLTRLMDEGHSRLYPFMLRFLVLRGDIEAARRLKRAPPWRTHAGDTLEAEGELLAARGAWDEAPVKLAEMRAHAAAADSPALVTFADRLEGRALLARGDAVDAATLLEQAVAGFADLGAVWERAITELDLARVLAASGRAQQAAEVAAAAAATFEQLGCTRDLARARSMLV